MRVARRWLLRRRAAAAPALAVLVLAAVGSWLLPPDSAPPAVTVAVLPLANFSSDTAQEYLVDGMTEPLIASLARLGGLNVISRTSIMRYRTTDKSLPEIARELRP
jgi:TolB-like protein